MSHKPILIVGDFLRTEEFMQGIPFAAYRKQVLESLMRQAGMAKEDVEFTVVFNEHANTVNQFCGKKEEALEGYRSIATSKFVKAAYAGHLEELERTINRVNPNVILALGNTALWAVCKKVGLKKYRGSPLLSHDGVRKVIPSWDPATIIRQWNMRPIALSDFGKAVRQSKFPELLRPSRSIWINPELSDIKDFYHKYLEHANLVSCDIETKGETITEVGYAPDETIALVIPFYTRLTADGNYWPTLEDEREAWSWVRRINAAKKTIGQNFAYDMQYFWRTVGTPCPRFHGDTMLQHHALQPEMEKGLGFLGSIYTDEPSWKFMRATADTLKTEDS